MDRNSKWLVTILLVLVGLALVLFGFILVAVNMVPTNANPNFGWEFLGFALLAIAALVGYAVYRIWKYPERHEP